MGGHQEYEITAADSGVARGPGIKVAATSNSLAASRVSTPTQAGTLLPPGSRRLACSNIAVRATAVAEAPPERMTEVPDDRGIIVMRNQPQAPSRVGGGSGGNGGGGGGGGGFAPARDPREARADGRCRNALRFGMSLARSVHGGTFCTQLARRPRLVGSRLWAWVSRCWT